jgi:branched-chain amino acid transport system ATP-binding protein
VEQNARAAFDVAENGYVLENGKVMLQGPCSQLRNEQRVQEFYLGLSSLGKAISAN